MGRPPLLATECELISSHTITQSHSLLCTPSSQFVLARGISIAVIESSEPESHHSFEGLTSLACFHATCLLIAQLKLPLVVLVKHA